MQEYTNQDSVLYRTGQIGHDEDVSFDDFMQEQHMLDNPMVLDDDLPDSYDAWLLELAPEDVLYYAQEYNARCPEVVAADFCKENGIED